MSDKAFLMLADGTCFYGNAVGAKKTTVGELVFNTAQLGYQEILTDPSYFGQIINFTAPHIGNVGINKYDYESHTIHAVGAVFKNLSKHVTHCKSTSSLEDFLVQQNVVAITDIDTRALTLHIREYGSQACCIARVDTLTPKQALELARENIGLSFVNSAALVTTQKPYVYSNPADAKGHIVVIDCGVKVGILQILAKADLRITVVPYSIQFEELVFLEPDGVVLSNGPGNPEVCMSLIHLTKQLLIDKIPLFGICLGHQILALAAGAVIKKMKFGHHGANHPIQCLQSGNVFISSQNHDYVVDQDRLPTCFAITHRSLFDGSIAGLQHKNAPAFSFQGHPEANPGPKELGILMTQFITQVQSCLKTAV